MARELPGGDARGLFDTLAGYGALFEQMIAAALTEEELPSHLFMRAGTIGTEGSR